MAPLTLLAKMSEDLLKASRLALVALENLEGRTAREGAAIVALRQAIAQAEGKTPLNQVEAR